VTRPGGMMILCPGNNDRDTEAHRYLVSQGFAWSRFEEPGDGIKRKYWKVVGESDGGILHCDGDSVSASLGDSV